MKYGLFYGSLRKNMNGKTGFNFNRFGGQTPIKTLELEGYEMYSFGGYPAIIEGKGKIVAELHEVEENAAQYIKSMEQGAGYTETEIEVDNKKAALYVFRDKGISRHFPKVKSGDWAEVAKY